MPYLHALQSKPKQYSRNRTCELQCASHTRYRLRLSNSNVFAFPETLSFDFKSIHTTCMPYQHAFQSKTEQYSRNWTCELQCASQARDCLRHSDSNVFLSNKLILVTIQKHTHYPHALPACFQSKLNRTAGIEPVDCSMRFSCATDCATLTRMVFFPIN